VLPTAVIAVRQPHAQLLRLARPESLWTYDDCG